MFGGKAARQALADRLDELGLAVQDRLRVIAASDSLGNPHTGNLGKVGVGESKDGLLSLLGLVLFFLLGLLGVLFVLFVLLLGLIGEGFDESGEFSVLNSVSILFLSELCLLLLPIIAFPFLNDSRASTRRPPAPGTVTKSTELTGDGMNDSITGGVGSPAVTKSSSWTSVAPQ